MTCLTFCEAVDPQFLVMYLLRNERLVSPRAITSKKYVAADPMKQIVKILVLLLGVSAVWIGLLQASAVPESYTWLLPLYLIVALGCYGLFMVGIGLMKFPTCPQEALFLQQDVLEAKEFLKKKGVDVGSD